MLWFRAILNIDRARVQLKPRSRFTERLLMSKHRFKQIEDGSFFNDIKLLPMRLLADIMKLILLNGYGGLQIQMCGKCSKLLACQIPVACHFLSE